MANKCNDSLFDQKSCLTLIQAQLQSKGRDPADFEISFEDSDASVTANGDLVVYNKFKVHDNETEGIAEVSVAIVIHVTEQDQNPTPEKSGVSF